MGRTVYTSEVTSDFGRRQGAYKGMKIEVPALPGATGRDARTIKQLQDAYRGKGIIVSEDYIKYHTRIRREPR